MAVLGAPPHRAGGETGPELRRTVDALGRVADETRSMDLIHILRQLKAAERRRATVPRMSDEYFRAAREVDELSREVWTVTRAESLSEAARTASGRSSSTVLSR